MRLSGMPIDCAAWWSSATARSARPVEVFWKNTDSSATRARDDRGDQVFLVDQDAALERWTRMRSPGPWHADVDLVDAAAKKVWPTPSRK
jgi:hypothetical protein